MFKTSLISRFVYSKLLGQIRPTPRPLSWKNCSRGSWSFVRASQNEKNTSLRWLSTSASSPDGNDGEGHIFRSIWGEIQVPQNISYSRVLLDRFSERTQNVALINGLTGEKYSYGRMRDHVIRLANSLIQHGVEKGSVVTFYMPNYVEVPLLMLATSLTGATVNPINSQLAIGEVDSLMAISRPDFLITSSSLLEKLSTLEYKPKQIFTIEEVDGCIPYSELLSHGTLDMPEPSISTNDPAIIPHSSGTAGLPKGVVLSHGNLLAQILSFSDPRCTIIKEDDRTILVFPLAHIGGLNMVFNALYSLGTIVVFPSFDFTQYLEAIQKYKATQLSLPPPVNVRLYNDPLVEKYDLSTVRTLVCGAASIGGVVQEGVIKRLNLQTFRQAYGMTEVTGITHIDDPNDTAIGSGGKVLPFMQCKVVDEDTGKDLPPGEIGEIWMKGNGVMQGYLNNPEATKNTVTEDGWIMSGDVGYHSERGHLYIVDRCKDLIKYKGFQVSPAELEAVLLAHPQVADAAVIPVPDEAAGEVPKAFLVLQSDADQAQATQSIHAFINERVSNMKQLRGGITYLDVIPKLSSGKILKRVLRKMDGKGR